MEEDRNNLGTISLNPENISKAWADLRASRWALGHEFDEEPVLRFMYHPKSDTFKVWCGYKFVHMVFEEELTDEEGRYPLYLGLARVKEKVYVCECKHSYLDYEDYPDISETPIPKFFKDFERMETEDWNWKFVKNYAWIKKCAEKWAPKIRKANNDDKKS